MKEGATRPVFSKQSDSLSGAITVYVRLSQMFGLLPLREMSSNESVPKFRLNNPKMAFCLFMASVTFVVAGFAFVDTLNGIHTLGEIGKKKYKYYKNSRNLQLIYFSASFAFYLNAFLISVAFLQLAKSWPKYLKYWRKVERRMKRYRPPVKFRNFFLLYSTFYFSLAISKP